MHYRDERLYVSNLQQLMPYKEYRLSGGRMEGVRAIDLSNGRGLTLTVLPDRCMDIFSLQINGRSYNYLTPNGVVHPAYRGCGETDFLKSFAAGFLTTCGLRHVGIADGDFPLHGIISDLPAQHVNLEVESVNGVPELTISGTMRETALFGPNMSLTRRLRIRYGNPAIHIEDTIRNEGWHEQPFMMLYHFNMGYPLLSEKAELYIDSDEVSGRDDVARAHIDSWEQFMQPQDQYPEQCFYHRWRKKEPHTVTLKNPDEGMYMSLTFDGANLDQFVQWKVMEKGTYVLGLEPCNATLDGKADARKNGSYKTLAAGQTVVNRFEIRTAP